MNTNVSEILKNSRRIHFVGIGGSGMFPLVEILHGDGFVITGSDVNAGSIIDAEKALGIEVKMGHDAKNVDGADALVVTAALLEGNPEVARAHVLGIPVIDRADMLGYVTQRYSRNYCICGTHGKTTTTAMLTSIFMLAGLDTAAVIGGKLPLINGYGRRGSGDTLVCEACEFKDTFLHLSPAYAVLLNVDADHLDYFKTLSGVIDSFSRFCNKATRGVIANGDDKNTMEALKSVKGKIVLFGEDKGCDYIISDIENYSRAFYSFTLSDKEKEIGKFSLKVPGLQNVHNAAAAAVAALSAGLTAKDIQTGLDSFFGAARRFEMLGKVKGATIADDYAHHPTELAVTLDAALKMGYDRVIAVFQPFTYTRTKLLLDDFARVLKKADAVVMTEIMGSREVNTCKISTADLAAKIDGSVWFKTFEEVSDYCLAIAREGDLIITLGCGDIYKAANMMLERGAKSE
ncbi:MAG: UDP-N-acetylmuramate--L-alanine ligase [Oscillospiraceae bacterium]